MHNFTPLSGLIGGALIGLASALLMLSAGRLAGVSGILGGLLTASSDRAWRIAFIAGLIVAALVGPLFGAPGAARLSSSNLALYAVAGLLVGFGSRMGNGCTSGHGVCGFARFSMRSITATLVFMGVAVVTVLIVRHGFGG
ncbi:YeeE/YedE thiosulfate transporter family protein [Bradyrhizobium sp.]|uniref:YeeE/YedE family protein n=1 Tax=Bradyrhizobium sp. TaxID=376 RepID=UPI002624F5F5|nr:YeeE/YedE thiosulfate transporter family protein [Bradyrhizobium sp.]